MACALHLSDIVFHLRHLITSLLAYRVANWAKALLVFDWRCIIDLGREIGYREKFKKYHYRLWETSQSTSWDPFFDIFYYTTCTTIQLQKEDALVLVATDITGRNNWMGTAFFS